MADQQKALTVSSNYAGVVGCFGRLFGFVFCSMFFGMGCFFLWMIALQPLLKIMDAKSWVETPCTITKSTVEGNETYRIVIEYDYVFAGQQYHGDQYDFFSMATNGRTSKERVVAKYKEGTEKTCYVNPDTPTESVINRAASAHLWWGLFPLPFIGIGLAGYWVVFFGSSRIAQNLQNIQVKTNNQALTSGQTTTGRRTRVASQSEWSNSEYDEEDLFEEPGPVTLKNDSSPLGIAIFLLIFATIWNGVISVFIFDKWDEWIKFDIGFEDLFFVPFILVGIGVILAFIYNVLRTFNPKPTLTLSRQLIPLGGTAQLQWQFTKSTNSIRELTVKLIGQEEAVYRRGTNTYTDHETFHDETLLATTDPLEIPQGEIEISIPSETMHSFDGGNNKIIWRIEFSGDIKLWPDVSAKFPIRVVPHE